MRAELTEVLRVILALKASSSLKDIESKTELLGIKDRKLLRALNDLIASNRVRTVGQAASTMYWQRDVREAYSKDYRLVFVHKGDKVAGYLFQSPSDFVFCYTDEYLLDAKNEIPGLPLDIAPYVSPELHSAFDENLPEGVNREMLELSLGSSDELDILVRLTHNIGDIYFTLTGESQVETYATRPSFLSNAENILGPAIPFPSILDGYTLEMSEEEIFPEGEDLSKFTHDELPGISGFQYKRLVDLDRDGRRIHQDTSAGTRAYIFKPYGRFKSDPKSQFYFPHLAINEHLFMSFAKNELGFRVPQSHLIRREGDQEFHYLVKRFDRLGTYRFAKANFSTYLGLRADTKYNTTSEKMFTRIKKELISDTERLELLKHYLYSMIISHEDMHTKNLSLIISENIKLMSPLYDIATTRIYSNTKGYDSHLSIDGQRSNITPRHFEKLVEILGVNKKSFKEESRRMCETFRDVLPSYIDAIKLLGPLPFFTLKQKVKAGEGPSWVPSKEFELSTVLESYYDKRTQELVKLGWL
ncbi:MAG: type II toxin-antitoxin system HipA family toxin [Sulfuricurvum sp.]